MKSTPQIRDVVRYAIPDPHGERFARGRVVGIRTDLDLDGARTWFHVTWTDANGKPDNGTTLHGSDELEVIE